MTKSKKAPVINTTNNALTLRVSEALSKDVGRGIARIDPKDMEKIDAQVGDIIEIDGKKKTVAKIMPAYVEDRKKGIIQMDGLIRENAQIGIDEKVSIQKTSYNPAERIILSPMSLTRAIRGDRDIKYIGRLLEGLPLTAGDRVRANLFGARSQDFTVISTIPKGAVLIHPTTNIRIKEEEAVREKGLKVSYEDIGGLDKEIQRIREMIELPLRHPQVFERLGIDAPKGVLLHGPPGCGKTLIARAVANETDAYFNHLSGPEIMHKFYGECVAADSLIAVNEGGLVTIQDANLKTTHTIGALEMQNKKVRMLPVSDKYDKGVQKTITILTSYGDLTLTRTSKLLVLRNGKPEWSFVYGIKKGDYVATAKRLPTLEAKVPNLIDFLSGNTYLTGENIKKILNCCTRDQKNKDIAQNLNVKNKTFEGWKYRKAAPAKALKKLKGMIDDLDCSELKLSGKGKIPTKMNKDLAYVLGLLIGDGHLRYRHAGSRVTTIIFTNTDKEVIKEYKRILKEHFGIQDVKFDGRYGYYFSSSGLGNLFYNLGIPVKNKSRTASIPAYVPSLPKEFRACFLRGLYDSDGYVHFVKSGKQIVYYTMSKKLAMGIRMLLLQFEIQSTMRRKEDGTYEVTINNYSSIEKFRDEIGLANKLKSKKLYQDIKVNYHKPVLDRIPITRLVRKIAIKNGIGIRELLRNGINVKIDSLTEEQIKRFLELMEGRGNDNGQDVIKLQKLIDTDILWAKVKDLEESDEHVYDFSVSNEHNFIANGFIVHNSEAHLRSVFEDASAHAPSIIFLDELDAIAPKREELGGEKQVERRVVAQLLALLDGLESRGQVIVIGATNIPGVLDPALRRPGRFDREITISIPDKNGRMEILYIHTRGMPLAADVDLKRLAEITHGFVGADLEALCREAAMVALRKIMPKIEFDIDYIPYETLLELEVTMDDFLEALKEVEPSAIREVFTEIPDVKWDDVGGLEEVKQVLMETIEWPLKHSKLFKHAKTKPPKGILLHGSPGTGKTLVAKAVANESEVNFISVKGPALISKWVGESEKGIREVFKKAKQASPCIIFFDELDALAPVRGAGGGNSHVTDRVISQFLTELDGIEELKGVVVLGATNRLDMVDPALLRTGRFDFLLELLIPDEKTRLEIFKIHTRGKPLAKDVDLKALAKATEALVGSDIESICKKASMLAIRDFLNQQPATSDERPEKDYAKFKISMKYFVEAIKEERLERRASHYTQGSQEHAK